MIFKETPIPGAYSIVPEKREDDRGFFARVWCAREFEEHGLDPRQVQTNISFNRYKGTVRGLHYQIAPHAENKLVRCTSGAIFDVVVDLRPDSPTFSQWFGLRLSAEEHNMLLVPEGCAHGFQTLCDSAEVSYQVSEYYAPEAERGARYDDPAFAIDWPLPAAAMSPKDAAWAPFGTEHEVIG